MSTEIKVPPLPESVSEATVVTWHKKPGDKVSRDENLVDIETDKVVLEVPAPEDGVLQDVSAEEGDTVTAGQVLGKLESGGGGATAEKETKSSEAAAKEEDEAEEPAAKSSGAKTEAPEVDDLSPAVRKLVVENDLDPAEIEATGPGGRLTKEDVQNYLKAGGEKQTPKPQPEPAPQGRRNGGDSTAARAEAQAEAQAAKSAAVTGERPERRVPMTRLRQRIAERLVDAQQTAAILTTFNECNMQPVMDLRAKYKDKFEKAHDVRLGFMSFFVKAAVEALKRFPAINASIDGTDIMYHGYYDMGIAVSSPRGLVVPVLRDADRMSFAEIESTINDFGLRARDGKLSMDELTGGTFSITNGGIFGSLLSTPILNPPQSGILGMHKIQERAMVENGQVVVRPMMYLALSYDHRIVDGKEAVQCLVAIKEAIEDPARLLLEV